MYFPQQGMHLDRESVGKKRRKEKQKQKKKRKVKRRVEKAEKA